MFISKNVYILKLDDIANKHNNAYHSTIKIKPVDIESNKYINSSKQISDHGYSFKIGDIVRISKYKNIFAKGYFPNQSEEIFVIQKVKNTVSRTYITSDLQGKEIAGTCYEKELQKTNQKMFRVEKVIKRKGGTIYVKWKGYDNSCIDKNTQYK